MCVGRRVVVRDRWKRGRETDTDTERHTERRKEREKNEGHAVTNWIVTSCQPHTGFALTGNFRYFTSSDQDIPEEKSTIGQEYRLLFCWPVLNKKKERKNKQINAQDTGSSRDGQRQRDGQTADRQTEGLREETDRQTEGLREGADRLRDWGREQTDKLRDWGREQTDRLRDWGREHKDSAMLIGRRRSVSLERLLKIPTHWPTAQLMQLPCRMSITSPRQ